MYRLLVTDIDGTLLNSAKEITEPTKKGIYDLMDKGIKFVIATGRVYPAAKWPYIDLGIDGPIISCNGALVKDTKTDEIIYERPLPNDLAKKVSDICAKYDVYFHYYTENAIHAEKYDFIFKRFAELSKTVEKEKFVETEMLADYNEFLSRDLTLYKMGVYCDDSPESQKMMDEIATIEGLACYKSLKNSYDVMAVGVSKGDAIAQLNKYYSIPREETIASGDNENDIDMIKYAGLGVAMDNAVEAAKEAADFITVSNEDDGLLHVINKFILDDLK